MSNSSLVNHVHLSPNYTAMWIRKMKSLLFDAWSDFIPDDALTSLDQRLLKIDAMIQDLNEFNDNLDKTKADNISIEKNIIQLTSHGEKIETSLTSFWWWR